MATTIKRALVSVSDKTGLVEFGRFLDDCGVEILSTGGSAKVLAEAGVRVREVADYTGFPEMMDGRIKTLHPRVHGGLLALRDNDTHRAAMAAHDIGAIDLVAVNLYPFEETVAAGAEDSACIENIDIGGPAMIRSAAKNHAFVTVIVDPADYQAVADEMKANHGATTLATRRRLAARAFGRTAQYDTAISRWFAAHEGEKFPQIFGLSASLRQTLRYGENPHQDAAFYTTGEEAGLATARQMQGKALSYNNINDADAAFSLIGDLPPSEGPAVAIIKHANACGVARAESLCEAYKKALACDPLSAFGGIVALNGEIGEDVAREITALFTEVVIAPAASASALAVLGRKKNLRLLLTGALTAPDAGRQVVRSVTGGLLVQSADAGQLRREDLKVVSRRRPDERETDDMLFAFTVAKHVKSNAIVYVRNGATVGIGAGQMSRVDSARIAALKAEDAARAAGMDKPLTKGSVVASDAFFPFADGLLAAASAGATAVIQPGGSMRDDEVIAAADEAGLAMVFTGMRHFRH